MSKDYQCTHCKGSGNLKYKIIQRPNYEDTSPSLKVDFFEKEKCVDDYDGECKCIYCGGSGYIDWLKNVVGNDEIIRADFFIKSYFHIERRPKFEKK